jgi:hypothetical protein
VGQGWPGSLGLTIRSRAFKEKFFPSPTARFCGADDFFRARRDAPFLLSESFHAIRKRFGVESFLPAAAYYL